MNSHNLKNLGKKLSTLLTLGAVNAGFSINLPVGPLNDSDPNQIPPDFAQRVYDILIRVAYPLAFAGIIYTAYIMLTSVGNPEGYNKAKKNLIYITTGIGLLIFAQLIFNFVRNLLTKA